MKEITIVAYTRNTANVIFEIISEIFGKTVNISKYILLKENLPEVIESDVVICGNSYYYEIIKKSCKAKTKIIICQYTIYKEKLKEIRKIKEKKVLVAHLNMAVALKFVSLLKNLDIGDKELIPWCYTMKNNNKINTVITEKEDILLPAETLKVVITGERVPSIHAIIELAVVLNDIEVINTHPFKKYKESIVINQYYYEKINLSLFQSDTLVNEKNNEGIIAFLPNLTIFSCNDTASKMLKKTAEEIVGNKINTLFPDIIDEEKKIKNFNSYLHQGKGNEHLIVRIKNTFYKNSLAVSFVILQKFDDSEKEQLKLRSQLIKKGHKAKYKFKDLIGESEVFLKCKEIAKRMAESDSSILIFGETGTGKEIFAQAIHNYSLRKNLQFVAINCGALPESLLESELFGYEEGAFTGARKGGKAGVFEMAHKGTIFLDEIGEMPKHLQVKLLRVLQEKEVMRIGSDTIIPVDVRIIAATNKNLKEQIEQGEFRSDLYYRLNILPIHIPSLKEREEDILLLINYFKKEFNSNFTLTYQCTEKLLSYNWQGNIRELRNCIEYFVNLRKNEIDIDDLPMEISQSKVINHLYFTEDEEKVYIEIEKEIRENLNFAFYIMEVLYERELENKLSGRRSIKDDLKNKNIDVPDNIIRSTIKNLQKFSVVEVSAGRKGTFLTELGKKIYQRMNMQKINKD